MKRALYLLASLVCAAACDVPEPADDAGNADVDAGDIDAAAGDANVDAGVDSTERIPSSTDPCLMPRYWPRSVGSATYPVMVHYRTLAEDATARAALGYLETAWQVEIIDLGFTPPLPDQGHCGPDDRFDAFLWAGNGECFVTVGDDNPATAWDDYYSYMVVDQDSEFAGIHLDATIAHEFNHASQASDDWWETPCFFEWSAQFIENVVVDADDAYLEYLPDFQSKPDLSIDYNDDYDTWYMYGGMLYLQFLQKRYFAGSASFLAEIWRQVRNPPGADSDPALNEPDFEDALEAMLWSRQSVHFADTVAEFARWRYFTGSRDDGLHLPDADLFDALSSVRIATQVNAAAGTTALSPAPMRYGNAYVQITGQANASVSISIDTSAAPAARWLVQAVPGLTAGSDGDLVDVSGGAANVQLGADGKRVVVVTVLPSGSDDPDTRANTRYPVSLVIH